MWKFEEESPSGVWLSASGLLLLCAVTSWPRDAQTKPLDFICNKPLREALNVASRVERELLNCEGLAALPNPVQLPCTALHVTSWENKSLREKRGDIVASLRLLNEGVEGALAPSRTPCATAALQRLRQSIDNYLLILTHLHLSGAAESQSLSCVPRSSRSVSEVLQAFNKLLSGKLERFMEDLQDRCAAPQDTTVTPRRLDSDFSMTPQ